MVRPNPNIPPPSSVTSPTDVYVVMVPCFLKVTIRGEDEHDAEFLAVEEARKMGTVSTPGGSICLGSVMTPMTTKL